MGKVLGDLGNPLWAALFAIMPLTNKRSSVETTSTKNKHLKLNGTNI